MEKPKVIMENLEQPQITEENLEQPQITEENLEETIEENKFDPDKFTPEIKEPFKLDKITDDDDDDDDMDSEDKARMQKQFEKGSRSIVARQQSFEDQQSVNNIIINQPELQKYQPLALKYMKAHPTLTAQDAMSIASAKDQQKIGALKERKAQAKVARTVTPGTSYRKSSNGPKDWSRATSKEIETQIARAKGQRI